MFRSGLVLLPACLAFAVAPQMAIGADYWDDSFPEGMRGSYNWSDTDQIETPLGFEFGLRYLYSRGGHSFSVGGTEETSNDTSHILEGHLRIDDYSTKSFLRGNIGYAIATTGDYSGDWGSGQISDGTIGYIGGDLGQYWLGDPEEGVGLGGFIGYQYLNDNPDIGRANFTTAASVSDISWSTTSTDWTVPYDSEPNTVEVHMLRLGASARAELNDMVDISLDVAAIPYASISGTLGAFGVTSTGSNPTYIQSSVAEVDGWGYGAAADLMLGFHPFENMVLRMGGRARYLQGTYDATYSVARITDQEETTLGSGTYDIEPGFSNQGYITTDNPFSMWRVNGLLELTGSF
jgi:hypothetical protein